MLRRLGFSKRTATAFDIAVLVFATIGCIQLVIWADRTPPVEVHFRVIRTLSVKPGEEFRYLNFFTRREYCDTLVSRWFVASDKTRVDIDPLPSFMPTEALNVRQISEAKIRVPFGMPPGVSKSCFRSRWQCNPVQRLWPLDGPETCLTFIVDPPTAQSQSIGEPHALFGQGRRIVRAEF